LAVLTYQNTMAPFIPSMLGLALKGVFTYRHDTSEIARTPLVSGPAGSISLCRLETASLVVGQNGCYRQERNASDNQPLSFNPIRRRLARLDELH